MRQNEGRTRLRRCAKSVSSDVPLYSSPLASSRTEKLMLLKMAQTMLTKIVLPIQQSSL